MKISKNNMLLQSNVKLADSNRNATISLGVKNNKKGKSSNTVYAGNINTMRQQDAIASNQVQAKRQAMKSIMAQYKNDVSFDEGISSLKDHQQKLSDIAENASQEITRIEDLRKQLKETCGITDDSEEEKNLNLLRKSMDPEQTLSDDEMEQLKNIGPLTDYQKASLEYDAMEDVWQERCDNANEGKKNISMSIESAKLEKLKSCPMVEAQKEALKIMEAARKDLIDGLMNQAKDKVDDTIKKNEEEAEKKAEEEAEKEEEKDKNKKDKVNEEGNQNQPLDSKAAKDLQESAAKQDKIKSEIKNAINKLNIPEDDTKGIEVDNKV